MQQYEGVSNVRTMFIDHNADLETIDFISKSLDKELYELLIKGSPLDKTKLVQVERMVTRNGKQYKKLMWVLPHKVTEHHTVTGNHHLLDKNHVHYKEEGEDTKPKEVKRKSNKKKQSEEKKEATKTALKDAAKKTKKDTGMANLFDSPDSTPKKEAPKPKKKKKGGLGTSLSQLEEQYNNSSAGQQTQEYLDKLTAPPKNKPQQEKPKKNDTPKEKPAEKTPQSEAPKPKKKKKGGLGTSLSQLEEQANSPTAVQAIQNYLNTLIPPKKEESQSSNQDNMDSDNPSSLKEKVKENLNSIAASERKTSRTKSTYVAPMFALKKGDKLPKHLQEIGGVPAGWKDVRIAYDEKSDIYATGYDKDGKKQYIYSDGHIELASKNKYEFLEKWCTPEGQKKVHDAIWNMTKTKAYKEASPSKKKEIEELSAALKLMYSLGIRVDAEGDEEGTKESGIGITSLRGEHVTKGGKSGKDILLTFVGKSGVQQHFQIKDPELKKLLEKYQRKSNSVKAHKGGKLFDLSYNKIHQAVGDIGLLPKDLRTLCANKLAKDFMKTAPQPPKDYREFMQIRKQCSEYVGNNLGNQPDEALGSYIDPGIFKEYSEEHYKTWEASNEAKEAKKKERKLNKMKKKSKEKP